MIWFLVLSENKKADEARRLIGVWGGQKAKAAFQVHVSIGVKAKRGESTRLAWV
jgi:hypothetical protein